MRKLLFLGCVLALCAAAGPALRASAARVFLMPPMPEAPPDTAVLEAPTLLPAMLEGLKSGATPWLLAAQVLRAELESGGREPRAQLESLLGALPWDAAGQRPYGLWPDMSPGLHPVQVGGLRGTLAVTVQSDGRRTLALGARGGVWQLVISARGRLTPGAAPVPLGVGPGLLATAAPAPATLELAADVSWTRPGSGSARARTWTATLATAPGDPLRAPDGGRAGGTVRIAVTAPDGRTGQLALELAHGGLRAKGRWLDEEITTAAGRIVVQSRATRGPAHRVEVACDGGPLTWRAVSAGPAGRIAGVVDGRLDPTGPVGTWQDLAAEPPAAGSFHLIAGQMLVVADHLGRTTSL